jgi:HEAT repeat protein
MNEFFELFFPKLKVQKYRLLDKEFYQRLGKLDHSLEADLLILAEIEIESKLWQVSEGKIDQVCFSNALGQIGDEHAVEALIACLQSDKASNARGSAANALGYLGVLLRLDQAEAPAEAPALLRQDHGDELVIELKINRRPPSG